ncbi:hypothetical protein H8S95_03925 [Pontibacter sp. KCTC 32443]|uniref:hypothetical protein n=1 Tax=Pontibacter TaxID=323449 RepID=UPI00164E9D40|nr:MULTISPECIES: hypothetical protein [Pontibacter]MBC5773201.1 hypothetical protein [Pontibacter sp. KCTC 32443]
MEGNDWYNRTGYTDYRNHFRGDDRPIDQSVFRGSYRFDNDSPHHNETTYNRYERRDEPRNYDRNAGYYSSDRGSYYNESRNQGREQQHRATDRNQRNYSRGYWQDEETHQPESMYRSTHISGNFEDNYYSDPYYANRGENYGNMAGSLSVGYDGDRNADWEEHRHYNPLTGHRRSYHGNYTSRHPESNNPNLGRSFDRNSPNDYERY